MKRLTIFIWYSCALILYGQDIHFSQFYMSPVQLNPALTGNFDGDWRFSGNQRSQWRSVSRPFNTIGLSAENREELLLPNLYHGINFFSDAAGDGNYRTIELNVTSSYEMYLDYDSLHVITPGIQLGFNHRRIDFSQLSFDSQFNGYYYDADLPTNEIFQTNNRTGLNVALGLIYSYRFEKRKQLTAGVGWFNLTPKQQSFYENDNIVRDKRLTIHGKGIYELNYEWDLQPGFLMQFQGKFKEIVIGSNIRYIYKDKKGEFIGPYAGLWFRNKDAVNVVVGAYYNQWTVGLSYDVNVSQLAPASNIRGGLEFGVQYIIHLFKPLDIQHRRCPDYL